MPKKKVLPLPLPDVLTDVDTNWVGALLYQVLDVPVPSHTGGTHDGITLFQRIASSRAGFRETCRVTAKCSSQPDVTHRLLVEIVPSDPDLRDIIVKHNLFAKELLVYEEVLPLLRRYVRGRSGHAAGGGDCSVDFSVPRFLYGDYDPANGRGVMVFEDFEEAGYRNEDETLMLLDRAHVEQVISNLATFHAICVAFQVTEGRSLGQVFPMLDGEKGGCAWFQDDMTAFLQEMYSTCHQFLQSIPGQEDLSHWFASKMSNPGSFHAAGQVHPTKLRSVVHGDLWHNNIFFRGGGGGGGGMELLLTDWQMCHVGIATNDLCFLLFSSTTPHFRRRHWDDSLRLFYDTFVSTLRGLGVSERQLTVSYDEFLQDVKASIPVSLFFCGNIQDLELSEEAASAREAREEEAEAEAEEAGPAGEKDEMEDALRHLQHCFEFYEAAKSESSQNLVEIVADEASLPPPTGQTSAAEGGDGGGMVLLQRRGLTKVPTIATDGDLAKMEDLRKGGSKPSHHMDARKARAVRRKMYLDLYREALNKGLI